jgi:succinoglycan biosynthesis protein ExoA
MEETPGSSDAVEISVLVPVLNEELCIRDAVARMCDQDFADDFELIFLDGRSTDRTCEILKELAREDPRIRVFDNPARRTPQALNLGLVHARGRLIARMDAHTYYPSNYLSAGANRLAQGGADWVSGPQLAEGIDKWSTRVALALTSPLGVGGAGFRRRMSEEVEVDSGFTGMWRHEVLDLYGGWDERWPVDQDFELAARMRADGRRIVCIPEMAAAYIPRNSIKRLAKQYWTYGYYRAKTSRAHPQSMRRSHVLAPGLALTILCGAVTPKPIRQLARLGIGVYLLALLYSSFAVATTENRRDAATLPLIFSCMHITAGFGFLAGCMRFGPPLEAIARLRP